MEEQRRRYCLVDGIRGIAIVNMAVFHFLYDVFIVYGKDPLWYGLPAIHIWQQMICQTFIFISGFVWQWGMEGNLRRGLSFNLYGHPIGNHMVRDIEFYGMCSPADVPAPEGGEKSLSGLGIGNLLCAVYPLQADTVWLYWDWEWYAGSGNTLFHKDSDAAWFSFSGI